MPSEETVWTEPLTRNRKYSNQEYFSLKLLEPLGHGAVGIVHPAIAELALESGDVLQAKLVFKLAFSKEQQEKMRVEFETYCGISRADGVEGVVDMHDLFYDVESGVMGMLMADGGKTLRQREIKRTGKYAEQVTTTWRERMAIFLFNKDENKGRMGPRATILLAAI